MGSYLQDKTCPSVLVTEGQMFRPLIINPNLLILLENSIVSNIFIKKKWLYDFKTTLIIFN